MKNLFCVIFIFIFISACQSHRSDYGWPTSGVQEADSLSRTMQRAFDFGASDDSLKSLISRLENVSKKNKDNVLVATLHKYWDARFKTRSGMRNEANDIVLDAMASLDSARHTYYYYKLRSLLERTTPHIDRRYRLGAENTEYFRSIGDSLSVAHSLLTTANLLLHIGETSKAEAEFREASKIWKEAGLTRNYYNNGINIALCLQGEKEDSLYRVLIESPVIKQDTAAYTLLIRNMAFSAKEKGNAKEALDLSEKGLKIIGKNKKFDANAAVLYSIKAEKLLEKNDLQGALEASRNIFNLSNMPIEKYEEYVLLLSTSKVYGACGINDTALLLLNRALDVRTDKEFELNNITLSVEKSRQELMKMKFDSEINSMRNLLWISIFIILLIIMASIVVVLNRKIKYRKIKEELTLAQLEESRSHLAREILMYEQNEALIDNLKSEIEALRDKGEIKQKASSQLLSELRMQIADRSERQVFLDIHDHMLPGFSAKLKADFNDLTEHQIKLSAYISAGMSNQQIAKLLNITPASVRTLRYRMRTKFGLQRNESLEEFLRKYST